ncbi:outer membrane beta-barrel protein [Halomonas cerina]|uniref:OOP family OmpA-OmpF porin n=1 Tax=Halomonas cerina TaxID=447424 RepID=A0A839VHY2_9GAMM|nr:outer membrane beta-barrel protein [Halomonas cerina]MBB3192297.1 OOP family OmpA-OmpF porin [Halomonas cerina]
MQRLIATAVLAGLVATPAVAQNYQYQPYNPDEGLYLGAGIGEATLDSDTFDQLDSWGLDTDDSDTAYKLFAGYQFNPNFALEASYLDFGEFKANATVTDGVNTATADIDLSFEGFGIALVGKLPIQNGFSLHAKVGMFAWDGEVSGTARYNGDVIYDGESGGDGTDPYYGLGAEYQINQVILRAEYERYELSDSGEDFEIDVASASLGYRF